MNWLNIIMAIVALGILLGGFAMLFSGTRAMGEDDASRRSKR